MTFGNGESGLWRQVVVAAAALAIGVAGTVFWLRPPGPSSLAPTGGTTRDTSVTPSSPDTGEKTSAPGTAAPASAVTLSDEAVRRAGIVSTLVETGATATSLRLPAVVEPNAYRSVAVTPLVAGRVTRVFAALGDSVSDGDSLAEVFSPELSEVQARYLTMSAEFEAAHQQLRRTERLAEIGAASAQELERVRAEHTTHATDVETARARLMLFGVSAEQIARLRTAPDLTATVTVRAPQSGVVTEREANVGRNVDLTTQLFRIVDLSTVWVVADLHERDFGRVRVGTPATVTMPSYPDLRLQSRVTYLDPQVRPETRTARIRVDVPNAGRRLRLGMYADVVVEEATATSIVVPRSAVQTVGGRQVVYVVDSAQTGRFVERVVQLGTSTGDQVTVVSGLAVGERVVSQGGFALRAERDRQGQAAGVDPHASHGPSATGRDDAGASRTR